jgi:hypothetical protein
MGLMHPFIVTVFFDVEGNCLGPEQRPLSESARTTGAAGIFDDFFDGFFYGDLENWQEQLGFTDADIHFREFFLPQYDIGAESPARHWSRINDGLPPDHLACTEEEIAEHIRSWKDSGMYSLWWGKQYDVDAKGDIVGT